jgi:hypothetical protein
MKKLLILLAVFNLLTLPVLSQGVGINETGGSPHASSILDVNSSDKGLLIPRVALVSPTNPIASPATSLLVYNTSTSGAYPIPGFYYFNGTDWVPLGGNTTINSKIIPYNLTTLVTSNVSTSSSSTVTLFNINYTPINDTIFVEFNAAARVSSCSGCQTTPLQKWGFRIMVNSSIYKIVYAHPNTNQAGGGTSTGDLVVSFKVPVPVTPNTSVNIMLQMLGLFTTAGSMTLRIDPTTTTEFANLIIHDVPTN